MAIYLNIPTTTSISNDIFTAIRSCEPEIKGNFRISLLDEQTNDLWLLKIDPEHGNQQSRYLAAEHQNPTDVRRAVIDLYSQCVR